METYQLQVFVKESYTTTDKLLVLEETNEY